MAGVKGGTGVNALDVSEGVASDGSSLPWARAWNAANRKQATTAAKCTAASREVLRGACARRGMKPTPAPQGELESSMFCSVGAHWPRWGDTAHKCTDKTAQPRNHQDFRWPPAMGRGKAMEARPHSPW